MMESRCAPKIVTNRNGTTLMELSVVIALLSIVTLMIVSFSAIVEKYVIQNQEQYIFFEETAEFKRELMKWLSDSDETGAVFSVTDDSISLEGTGASVSLESHAERVVFFDKNGGKKYVDLKNAEDVKFSIRKINETSAVVKCTVTGADSFSKTFSQSFVLTLRCASFIGEEAADE